MQVYGQLKSAALELLGADPGTITTGRIWWNTVSTQILFDDGTDKLPLLRNDSKIILGTDATAANNVRFNRCANGVLQLVTADDVTAEGTLSTSVAQLDFRVPNYAAGLEPVAGLAGRMYFDTSSSQFKFDDGVTWTGIQTDPTTLAGQFLINQGAGLSVFGINSINADGFVLMTDSALGPKYAHVGVNALRNHLVNGAFDYWQSTTLGTLAAAATKIYGPDQWYLDNEVAGAITDAHMTITQVAGAVDGTKYGAQVKVTQAPTGAVTNGGYYLTQPLTNIASLPFYNQGASISCSVKALGNITQVTLQLVSHATTEGVPATVVDSVACTVNSAGFTLCKNVLTLAAGTAWGAGGNLGVRIKPTGVSSGNTYDLNNGFIVEQVILNIGGRPIPFMRQFSDPQAEFASCLPFYEKSYNPGEGLGTADFSNVAYGPGTTANVALAKVRFLAPKRITPTISYYDTAGTLNDFSTFDVNGTPTAGRNSGLTFSTAQAGFYALGAVTAGQYGIGFHWAADARI